MSVTIREYEVPYYRMRALYTRLDALLPHVNEREGLSLSYSSSPSIVTPPRTHFRSFRYRSESLRLEDGVQGDGFSILAVIDRRHRSILPLFPGAEDDSGEEIPTITNGCSLSMNLRRRWSDQLLSDFVSSRWVDLLDGEATCERCHHKVAQGGTTYLVMDEAEGRSFEVGSCCLSKYAGGLPSRYATRYASIIAKIVLWSQPEMIEHLPTEATLIHADRAIACGLSQIDGEGYPAGEARAYDTVALRCSDWLSGAMPDQPSDELKKAMGKLDEARRAWQWVKDGLPGARDTCWAKRAIMIAGESQSGLIETRDYGVIAATALTWHRTEVGKRLVKESKWMTWGGGDWVGAPGEKFGVTVIKAYVIARRQQVVHFRTCLRTTWGFLTDDGNIILWSTTLKDAVPESLGPDNPMILTGKVSDRGEYGGVRQTVATRCKVLTPDEWDRVGKGSRRVVLAHGRGISRKPFGDAA